MNRRGQWAGLEDVEFATVTKSSTEAELVALSDYASQALWMRNFLVVKRSFDWVFGSRHQSNNGTHSHGSLGVQPFLQEPC